MEDYLNYTLNVLKSRNYVNLTIVLGNESCDLDSAVSSLVYATFLHWQHQKMKCKVCTRNKRDETTYKDDIFVSLLDVDRQDLPLKTEVAFCFKGHGLKENFLLFRDDIDLKKLVEEGKINIVLVDHHVLSKKYEFLSPYVTEIIDHRPIDKNNWSYKDDVRSTIEIVGSCCTLVTQRIQDLSALMNRGDFFDDYEMCADLLHSVILLDTVNFSKEVNKATPHDKDKVEFLENILKPSDCMEERKLKVQRLVEARSDVALLNAAQLLRKDVKILGDVLIPSFPILVEVYLRKPEALKAVSEALSQRNCTVALLLGMDLTGALRRDGAIISDDAEKVELDQMFRLVLKLKNVPKWFAITDMSKNDSCQNSTELKIRFSKILQEWSSPCLQLLPEENSDCFFFKQLNLSASRKQYIAPVNEFLNNCN